MGSSLSTIIISAPLAFLSGVTGAFFKALSLTMAASLVISFLIACLAVPILADHFLGEKDANQAEGGGLTARVHRWYGRPMRRVLARPALVLLGVMDEVRTKVEKKRARPRGRNLLRVRTRLAAG